MDLGPHAAADLLERALQGEDVADPATDSLLRVARAVSRVRVDGLAPRAEFVAGLRERLLTADLDTTDLDTTDLDTPSLGSDQPSTTVIRLPRRPSRLVAAAAAAVIVVAAALGVVSRSALPGDLLYPVKQLLDRAAVQLAGSRLDEGLTHLAQTQQHITEARELLDRGDAQPAELDTALNAASESFIRGETILLDVYRTEHRAEALTELDDFIVRALPQVDAMDARIPAPARPAYERLRALLDRAHDSVRALAQCPDCGTSAARARAQLAATASPNGAITGTPTPGVSNPSATGTPVQPGPGITVPGAGADLPGAGINLPGATLSTDTAGVGGGGATLPGASLELPTAGASSSTVVLGGGGVTLPGATLELPTLTATLPLPTGSDLLP